MPFQSLRDAIGHYYEIDDTNYIRYLLKGTFAYQGSKSVVVRSIYIDNDRSPNIRRFDRADFLPEIKSKSWRDALRNDIDDLPDSSDLKDPAGDTLTYPSSRLQLIENLDALLLHRAGITGTNAERLANELYHLCLQYIPPLPSAVALPPANPPTLCLRYAYLLIMASVDTPLNDPDEHESILRRLGSYESTADPLPGPRDVTLPILSPAIYHQMVLEAMSIPRIGRLVGEHLHYLPAVFFEETERAYTVRAPFPELFQCGRYPTEFGIYDGTVPAGEEDREILAILDDIRSDSAIRARITQIALLPGREFPRHLIAMLGEDALRSVAALERARIFIGTQDGWKLDFSWGMIFDYLGWTVPVCTEVTAGLLNVLLSKAVKTSYPQDYAPLFHILSKLAFSDSPHYLPGIALRLLEAARSGIPLPRACVLNLADRLEKWQADNPIRADKAIGDYLTRFRKEYCK